MPDESEAEKVEKYRNGRLTRDGMIEVIKAGGSVLHDGKIYSKVSDLPDEATLTEGDEQGARQAQAGIDAQIAALAAQRAALDATAARARDNKPTPVPKAPDAPTHKADPAKK